jgi:DNA repair exonuclease SbcCD ATPase subunit
MSDDRQIARLVAQIGDLQQQLGDKQTALSEATSEINVAKRQLIDLGGKVTAADQARAIAEDTLRSKQAEIDGAYAAAAKATADYQALSAKFDAKEQAEPLLIGNLRERIAELEAQFADPPSGSGIDKVTRFRTSDGAKHKTLPDAQQHAAALGVVDAVGVTMTQAQLIVAKRDLLAVHFAVADQSPQPTAAEP